MRYIIVFLTLMFAAAVSAFAECSDADKKAFEAFDAAWSKAGQDGDPRS